MNDKFMSDKIRVMVIDDEVHMVHLISRMLEGFGFVPIESGSGKNALNILDEMLERDEILPDIITCDISMPNINGYEFLTIVKENPKLAHIPIIMLTAMGQMSEAKHAKEMGASDYITKPFSAMSLVDILREHVSK